MFVTEFDLEVFGLKLAAEMLDNELLPLLFGHAVVNLLQNILFLALGLIKPLILQCRGWQAALRWCHQLLHVRALHRGWVHLDGCLLLILLAACAVLGIEVLNVCLLLFFRVDRYLHLGAFGQLHMLHIRIGFVFQFH